MSFWALRRVEVRLNEKEQLEQSAQESQRWLTAITSASADAILGIDADECIESWNRGAALHFG